eukprot:839741_1
MFGCKSTTISIICCPNIHRPPFQSISPNIHEDLHALGIKRGVHQTLILTEIERLQGTDFVVKGLTHGTDVVTMDDGQGHATKPAALRPPPPPQASPSFLSDDSDSDDSLVTSPKGKQKQKHHEDFWTVEGE